MRPTQSLRPHALNKLLYGEAKDNSQFEAIKHSMREHGFDRDKPLLVTKDWDIVSGATRWAAAKAVKIEECPTVLFEGSPWEIEAKLISENGYRTKTKLVEAREQRRMLEIEEIRGRERRAEGGDDRPSRSTDRVGKAFGVSGQTVGRNVKILDALDAARGKGNHKKADRMEELFNAGKTVAALDLIKAKKKEKRQREPEKPRTVNDHNSKAYSEFAEACAKVKYAAELPLLEGNLDRMREIFLKTRERMAAVEKAALAAADSDGDRRAQEAEENAREAEELAAEEDAGR
jgi:hypothetical protein